MKHSTLTKKAIDLCGGTQCELAEAMRKAGATKVRQGHVGHWVRGIRQVSPENAYYQEVATKGGVKVSDFHPYLKRNKEFKKPRTA